MRKEIIFTGFGGQGIILMGVIIARMMEHFPELEVTQAQSYGPASRGGACRTDVVISDQKINYPKSSRPDVMIFMSEEARKRLLGEADPERTLVVYDNTLIKAIPDNYKKTFAVPATGRGREGVQEPDGGQHLHAGGHDRTDQSGELRCPQEDRREQRSQEVRGTQHQGPGGRLRVLPGEQTAVVVRSIRRAIVSELHRYHDERRRSRV